MTANEQRDDVEAHVYITVPTSSGSHVRIVFADGCTAGDYQDVLKWLERVPWTTPLGDDEEPDPPCGCCTLTGGLHTAECVANQPDEYVIDDNNPGVLRAPRPTDYVGDQFPWQAPLGSSDGYTRAILGAHEDANALGAELEEARREARAPTRTVSRRTGLVDPAGDLLGISHDIDEQLPHAATTLRRIAAALTADEHS